MHGKPGGIGGMGGGKGPGYPGHGPGKPGHPNWVADHHHSLNAYLGHRPDLWRQWGMSHGAFMTPYHGQWHSWTYDHYRHHHPWYGPWNYRWDPYWNYLWRRYPAVIGLPVTSWAFNSVLYPMGLWRYSNPYWVASPVVVYDYSQPIVVSTANQAEPPEPALDAFGQARSAFYQGDYPTASRLADEALKAMPNDAAAHQFRALVYFALGDYRPAAATLNAVLAVSPGWDWATMIGLYPNVETYTAHLRRLERFIDDHVGAGDARFLLAYHYFTAGHTDAAVGQLREVVRMEPKDSVARQLLEMLNPPAAPPAPTPGAAAATLDNVRLNLEDFLGTWKAQGPDGAQFELTLNREGQFTWRYQRGADAQSMRGAFALQGNTLVMQPETGGVLAAEINPPDAGGFTFKPIGTSEVSQPLKFAR